MIGRGIALIPLGISAWPVINRPDLQLPKRLHVLKEFRSFPMKLTPATILDTAATQLPLLLIGVWFGAAAAGYLGLTLRVLAVPLALVGAAVAQVLIGELSARVRDGKCDNRILFQKVSKRLAVFGAVSSVLVFIAAPDAFEFVFGTEWAESGELARWSALAVGSTLLWNPISSVFVVYQRLGAFGVLNLCRLLAVGAVGAVMHSQGASLPMTILGMSIATATADLVGWCVARNIVVRAASTTLHGNDN